MPTAPTPTPPDGKRPKPGDELTLADAAKLIEQTTGLRCPIRTVQHWAEGDTPRLPVARVAGRTRLVLRRDVIRAANEFKARRLAGASA